MFFAIQKGFCIHSFSGENTKGKYVLQYKKSTNNDKNAI